MVTNEEVIQAQKVLFKYFMEQLVINSTANRMPVTVLDTDIRTDDGTFRLITHFSFYGRDDNHNVDEDKQ